MLKLSVLAVLVGLGILAWQVLDKLSSDAIGMALGVIFGIVAGLPAALLGAAAHRRESFSRWDDYQQGYQAGQRDMLTNTAQYQVGDGTVIDARPIVQRRPVRTLSTVDYIEAETGWRP